jgi:hypothetical protein
MEYKLCKPLKTRQVVPWEVYIKEKKVFDMSPLAASAEAIRQAVECGWYENNPDVDEMDPAEVVKIAADVWTAYSEAMGFDKKKSPSEPQTSQKE